MKRLDLIIENIEYAKLVKEQAHKDELLDKALAAARELRELKPVAWETLSLKFANGQVLSYEKPKDLPSYLGCQPLYALDEVTK